MLLAKPRTLVRLKTLIGAYGRLMLPLASKVERVEVGRALLALLLLLLLTILC